jgi:hypothetical protein
VREALKDRTTDGGASIARFSLVGVYYSTHPAPDRIVQGHSTFRLLNLQWALLYSNSKNPNQNVVVVQ